jgi:hypothetical protein
MAFHVMTDDDAKQFFDELKNYNTQTTQDDDDGDEEEEQQQLMGNAQSLEDAFRSINAQLKPGFGLEIVTMVDRSDAGSPAVKYHAVVDLLADDVSKTHAFEKAYTPHERAFIRLIMQRLVHETSHGLRKMDCINARTELTGNFKLSLPQAERVVQILLDEHWLRVSTRVEDDDDDDDGDDDEEGSDNGQSQKKKKRRANSKNKRRRDSVKNKLELAPRSYMELSHYLTHIGLDDDDLPQIILHRGD